MNSKSFLSFILLVATLGFGIYYYKFSRPCTSPIEYSIGNFDTEFAVSKQRFIQDASSAENIWESYLTDRQLFKYNPNANFKINLIFDSRQGTVIAKQKTEFGLTSSEDYFKSIDRQFSLLKTEYDNLVASHKARVDAFKTESQKYDEKVKYWNSQGGAPKSEYQALSQEQRDLNAEISSLNEEVNLINSKRLELNNILTQRNLAADKYNSLLASYNAKFGQGLEFDQAEYNGKEINIYEFKDDTDLTLVLAHELGHALGLNHVENSKSIMYYLAGNQSKVLTKEDITELKNVCKL